MNKIAVKQTNISVNFCDAMKVDESEIRERKNGDIVYNDEIYHSYNIKTFWQDQLKVVNDKIKQYLDYFDDNNIISTFIQYNKNSIMKTIATKIISQMEENKADLKNIILGKNFVFQKLDQDYSEDYKKQDDTDDEEEQLENINPKELNKFKSMQKQLTKNHTTIESSAKKASLSKDEQIVEKFIGKLDQYKNKLQSNINNISKLFKSEVLLEKTVDLLENEIDFVNETIEDLNNDMMLNFEYEQEDNKSQNYEQQPNKYDDQKEYDEEQNQEEQNQQQQTFSLEDYKKAGESNKKDKKKKSDYQDKLDYCKKFVKDGKLTIKKSEFNKLDKELQDKLFNIIKKENLVLKVAKDDNIKISRRNRNANLNKIYMFRGRGLV